MKKNLSGLSKEDLLSSSKDAVLHEREATVSLIEHLREVERRMLFLEMGYSRSFCSDRRRIFEFIYRLTVTEFFSAGEEEWEEIYYRREKKSGTM